MRKSKCTLIVCLLLIAALALNMTACVAKVHAADLMDGVNPTAANAAPTNPTADQQAAAADFALRLFRAANESGKSILISPLSVSIALSMTANGALRGKERITLETYVQMAYFDRILRRANVHLMRMSGGQYDLRRRSAAGDLRSQSGLDLDVLDHYNGSVRSVKTLSGGESFIASLSLALGLSEEIQAGAGGIRLDTMFVDEGFGSLDEDTLDQAMRALKGLAEGDRLIGIISHVSELRRQIDRQVVVRKDRNGGSSIKIVI